MNQEVDLQLMLIIQQFLGIFKEVGSLMTLRGRLYNLL